MQKLDALPLMERLLEQLVQADREAGGEGSEGRDESRDGENARAPDTEAAAGGGF